MTPLSVALTLWEIGLVSEADLVAWADAQILEQENPSDELFEISLHGPAWCLKWEARELTTRPVQLTFIEEFSLRACALNLASDRAATRCVDWASRLCMGEDLAQPEVRLGYDLDHLSADCQDMPAAIRLLREKLPALMPHCRTVATPFLAQVPDLSIERTGS
jgi:hypothetical protein